MKKMHVLIPMALAAALSLPAIGAEMSSDMAGMKMDAPKSVAGKHHSGTGVINKIDIKQSTVNLSHEAIPSLNWPAMTMSFKVTDKPAMKTLKVGEKVNFELTEAAKGQYDISKITPVKK